MARLTQPLSATEIKNAKAKDKKYKLSDGRGLALHILPNGSKLWRLKYRFNNKEKEYAIGTYPTISLAKARIKREELKELIKEQLMKLLDTVDGKDEVSKAFDNVFQSSSENQSVSFADPHKIEQQYKSL